MENIADKFFVDVGFGTDNTLHVIIEGGELDYDKDIWLDLQEVKALRDHLTKLLEEAS